MSQRHYTQLSYEERVVIAHEVAKMRDKVANINISEIARNLGRDKSTVSRELRRNVLVSLGLVNEFFTITRLFLRLLRRRLQRLLQAWSRCLMGHQRRRLQLP